MNFELWAGRARKRYSPPLIPIMSTEEGRFILNQAEGISERFRETFGPTIAARIIGSRSARDYYLGLLEEWVSLALTIRSNIPSSFICNVGSFREKHKEVDAIRSKKKRGQIATMHYHNWEYNSRREVMQFLEERTFILVPYDCERAFEQKH
jgi:hypothetical protein